MRASRRRHPARAKLIPLDADGCTVFFGADYSSAGDEFQWARASQTGGPVHRDLYGSPQGQTFLSGEKNSATADIQSSSDAARFRGGTLNQLVLHFFLQREPAGTSAFSDGRIGADTHSPGVHAPLSSWKCRGSNNRSKASLSYYCLGTLVLLKDPKSRFAMLASWTRSSSARSSNRCAKEP